MSIDADSIPRYAPPTFDYLAAAEMAPKCGDCAYFKEICKSQNGLNEFIGICVFEIFQADTFDDLSKAELTYAGPWDEPCNDYRKDQA